MAEGARVLALPPPRLLGKDRCSPGPKLHARGPGSVCGSEVLLTNGRAVIPGPRAPLHHADTCVPCRCGGQASPSPPQAPRHRSWAMDSTCGRVSQPICRTLRVSRELLHTGPKTPGRQPAFMVLLLPPEFHSSDLFRSNLMTQIPLQQLRTAAATPGHRTRPRRGAEQPGSTRTFHRV